ncbi:MAG TPA: class I SAM-dependent methyltransferase [Pyrinomonadaceae bacterium]|nr:class I SAM-dependent methyltransferase [Pyrinomonadaceae bacterium]
MNQEELSPQDERQTEVCQPADPRERFSSRVQNYVKYRPAYPDQIIRFLETSCGLTSDSLVADIGSGTGILSELFLQNGKKVWGVEPNESMRLAAEAALKDYPKFTSVNGSAEATTLPDQSIDLITAAQAFHWFDQKRARAEFARILKPNGWVVLLWNERRLDSTDFLKGFEQLLLKYGLDYTKVRHENVEDDIAGFYAPAPFKQVNFDNRQDLDLAGLRGRLFSASYTPEPGHRDYESMVSEIDILFRDHQVHGNVTIEYDTKLYYGHLA